MEIKKDLGSILTLLQLGESVGMPDVKHMPSVAKGASGSKIKVGFTELSSLLKLIWEFWCFMGSRKKLRKPHKMKLILVKKD